MRVLHVSESDLGGGAARGAFWLHEALVEAGVESRMFVARKLSSRADVVSHGSFAARTAVKLRARLDRAALGLYPGRDAQAWTPALAPASIRGVVARERPDIVHLHWVGGGFLSIGSVAGLGRPVVWTLRDMWPFTGGCHYSLGCPRYEADCGACPQLGSTRGADLSRLVMARKVSAWCGAPITPVAISTWLAACARRSRLFGERTVEVIPNGVDVAAFRPLDRTLARQAWGLPADRRVILFGALNAERDRRKGLHLLLPALRTLAAEGWGERAVAVVFGAAGDASARPALPLESRWIGHLHDDVSLALLYSAADVMVVPSVEEAFGKTLIEAMACGVPVVAFGDTGPRDIVEHRHSGYLARPGDPDDLAAGIAFCLADEAGRQAMGAAARRRVEEHFDRRLVAARYLELYRRLAGPGR